MIMIVAAEEGGEEVGGGRWESGERSEVQARSTLTSMAPKARSRSGEVATLDEVPRISLRVSSYEYTYIHIHIYVYIHVCIHTCHLHIENENSNRGGDRGRVYLLEWIVVVLFSSPQIVEAHINS